MCQINLTALGGAALGLVVLAFCNRRGVVSLWPYLLIGAVVWFCVLQSGIHATLAGVAVAMTVPLACSPGRPDNAHAPLSRLEHGLHPWIAYAVVPLFGFANAGVALGLFLGKQLAILSAVFVLSRLKLADRRLGANWVQVYGVAVLCGIGFTMSLFIGGLAFGDGSHQNDAAKLGVLLGSILSAIAGYIVLRLAPRGHKAKSSNAF